MPELRLPVGALVAAGALLAAAVVVLLVWVSRLRAELATMRREVGRRLEALEKGASRRSRGDSGRLRETRSARADADPGGAGRKDDQPAGGSPAAGEAAPDGDGQARGGPDAAGRPGRAGPGRDRRAPGEGRARSVDRGQAGFGGGTPDTAPPPGRDDPRAPGPREEPGSVAGREAPRTPAARETPGEEGRGPTGGLGPPDPGGDGEDRGFSRNRVDTLYAEWCETGRRPDASGALEVRPMRHAGSVQQGELSEARHRLEDASGTSDFVRFSPLEGDRGLLLPHPDVRFNPSTHGKFFPEADRALFADPANLTRLEPVEIRRRDDGRWERVDQ